MKILILTLLISFSSFAKDVTVVAIGKADAEKQRIVFFDDTEGEGFTKADRNLMKDFIGVLENDFSFYKKYFDVIKGEKLKKSGVSLWKSKNYSFVTKVIFSKDDFLSYNLETFQVSNNEALIKTSGLVVKEKLRESAHSASDKIYQKLTGDKSIFKSKIIFVSDRDKTRKKQIKELYMMDFDGRNPRRLTRHRGTVISPAISKDGKKVLFSLIREGRKKRNINLRVLDLETGKDTLVSSRPGINSGAVFMEDGDHIALTLSHQGNAEIYILNWKTGKLKRLTKHFAPDVDPSINVTGDKMAFLSGRPGAAHIYTMDTDKLESNVKRISFVGKFNATPRFSPDGREIAFSSWLDNRFDIFRIDHNGRNLSRLTKDFGSNEDPTYSNDGQFIAFSSQRVLSRRKAVNNVWIMDREGEIIGQITKNFGNCITPRWSR